jgi:hypothetical protein
MRRQAGRLPLQANCSEEDRFHPNRMPIKKSDLYSKLWASCDELRGGMDASQYKDYVLVLLFIKYISDKYKPLLNSEWVA